MPPQGPAAGGAGQEHGNAVDGVQLGIAGVGVGHHQAVIEQRTIAFLDAIQRNPSLWTAIVAPSGEGISLSYKR